LLTSPDSQHHQAQDSKNLSDEEFQEFEDLVIEYKEIFAVDSEDYGRTNRAYRRIDRGVARPTHQPPRRLPLAKLAEVNNLFDDMQRRGVRGVSPWSSPVVLVRNNGELRFCVDYRMLNDVTKKDCFPLPRNDDILDMVAATR
jgi:hypothetical protein